MVMLALLLLLLLQFIGYGLILVACVWIVVLAFNESLVWGVVCLLCRPAQLIYVIMNWEDCKNPVMCWGGGILCLLAPFFSL